MSIRDNVLPKLDTARAKIAQVGLRRNAVVLRRRVWSGSKVADGSVTNQDIVLTPPPRVRFQSPFAAQMSAIMTSGGTIQDRYYKIDKITPAYTKGDGSQGGYTPQQLRMKVGPDLKSVDPVIVLVGDDGMLRECTQVLLETDRSFGYSMIVQEANKPAVSLVSLAIMPAPATLARPAKLQLVVTGTYEDGSAYDVTQLVRWASDNETIATVDLLGVASGAGAGTANIIASIAGLSSPSVTLTVI